MASPVRLEILDAARVLGVCSVAELGDLLGRTPDSLYYHVGRLVDVGLLIACGRRGTARRDETLYKTPARRIRLPHDPSDERLTERRLKAFAALLRLTERDHRRAFKAGLAKVRGPARNIINGRIKGRLNQGELREVHELVDRILAIFERTAGRQPDGRDLHAITIFLTPIEPRTRRR